MQFGLGINIRQDEKTTELINSREGAGYYGLVAKTAEVLGYDSFWQSDHLMLSNNNAVFDCWSILSSIASLTTKLKLGSFVTPLFDPNSLSIIKRVLTTQVISSGRVIFGVGAGWFRPEYNAFGIRFPVYKKRIEILGETLEILTKAWDSNVPIDWESKNFWIHGLKLKPFIKRPPIWLGGASDKILQLVALKGEGWLPYELDFEEYANKLNRLNELLDLQGRKQSSINFGFGARIIARKTNEEAEDFVKNNGLTKSFKNVWGQNGHLIYGNYETCAEELGNYLDTGANYFVLSPQPTSKTLELMKLLIHEVIPRIR